MKLPIISIILVITTTNAISEEIKDQNLIETTCKNTPNYRLCITTLQADRGSAAADVAGLGLIMVAAVKEKSKEALSAVNKLMVKSRGNRKLTEALQQCRESYKAVLEGDVPEAEQSLRGNPKFAENGMADAAVEADSCEYALGGKSPLTGVNNAVRDLAVVARAIIRNLL